MQMMGTEILRFLFYSMAIVLIAKYVLVRILRKLGESLDLSAKAVGNIAGVSTSIPELLTICFSATTGLIGTSIYNVISSNVINLGQYLLSVGLNKNASMLRNKAIRVNIGMVIVTILIPLVINFFHMEAKWYLIPIFLALAILFYLINNRVHKRYFNHNSLMDEREIEEEKKQVKGKKGIILKYSIYLLLVGIALFFIGDQLGKVLETLCNLFSVSQALIGILLGVITSLPELITFFEAQRHHNKRENKEEGMAEATNNLLTSNILNLFVIQSIAILLYNIVK